MNTDKGHTWLRLYVDLPRKRRMRKLPETVQLFFVWYLCLWKEESVTTDSTPDDIAWYLRLPTERVEGDLAALRAAGYIDADGTPSGWSDRQYKTDSQKSTSRVKKHREMKQRCNVSETFHETRNETLQNRTDTDTDTEQKKTAVAPDGAPARVEVVKPWQQIVSYLNNRAGRAYSTNPGVSHQKSIETLLKAGHSLDDFRAVIDDRCAAWLHDDRMAENLRPSTLFRKSNFENYVGMARSGVGARRGAASGRAGSSVADRNAAALKEVLGR